MQLFGVCHLQSYVGESEHQLRRLFTEARRNAPSLLLLDEIDALCPRQRSLHNDIEQRVILCMCSELDAVVSCLSVSSSVYQILLVQQRCILYIGVARGC